MAQLGYTGKGDKEHGARDEHSLKDSGISYAGQTNRSSSAERKAAREKVIHGPRTKQREHLLANPRGIG